MASGKEKVKRAAIMLFAACCGTILALAIGGQGGRLLKPFFFVSVPLATGAVVAQSSLFIWGLIFTVPIYFIWSAGFSGASLRRVCLALFPLHAMLMTCQMLLGRQIGLRRMLLCLALEMLLMLICTAISGLRRSISDASAFIGMRLKHLRAMKEESCKGDSIKSEIKSEDKKQG